MIYNKMESKDGENEDHGYSSSNSSTILPWDRFAAWVHCICVVTFDLEIGQALEVSTNELM